MFFFFKNTGNVTKKSLDTFVSFLHKALPVAPILSNMDCLKDILLQNKVVIEFAMDIAESWGKFVL